MTNHTKMDKNYLHLICVKFLLLSLVQKNICDLRMKMNDSILLLYNAQQ